METRSLNPERLINILNKRGYRTWAFKLIEGGGLTFRCSLFNAYNALQAAKKCGIPLEIVKGVGLPFVVGKYRARAGLAVGTIFATVLILLSSFFIWDVRVVDREMTPELYNDLRAVGCHSGQFILGFDVSKAKHQFLLNNNEFSFFSINIRGTIAYVEIKERVTSEDKKDAFHFCHIIASDDAQIVDIVALHGKPVVSPGETVEQGQVIITGQPADKFGVIHPVKAVATVNAKVKKNFEVKIPLKQTEKNYTGRTAVKRSVYTFGMKLDLFLDEYPGYELTDVSYSFDRITVFDVIRLPFDSFTYKYKEFTIDERTINESEALTIAEKAFQNEIDALIGGGLLLTTEKSGKIDAAKEYYILSGEITFIKNIAVQEPFDFIPPQESNPTKN